MASTINTFMSAHHKECDEMFAKAEEALAKAEWKSGTSLWAEFATELENHLSREEEILFPEFEQITGMISGPTQMMRMEHEQMRNLISEINKAIVSKDQDQILGLTETLMITMQQHNMKEEQILYPMTDQSIQEASDVIERMSQHQG